MLLLHHPDLMDAVDIIGIMGRPLLLDMDPDIMDRLHPHSQVNCIMDHLLLLVDASISRAHLHHLDGDVNVDLLHLDMDQDIMDIETTKDEDLGPKVLIEEIIEDLLSLDTRAVLVHLSHASVRSIITTVVGMGHSPLGPKGMVMSKVPGNMVDMIIDLMGLAMVINMVMVTGMKGDIPSSQRRLSPKTQLVGRRKCSPRHG